MQSKRPGQETIVKFTPGKLAGMKAVSNERGVIAAAAMDQRGSLQKALAKEKGGEAIGDHDMEEFKILVTEVLTPHASAILLDPEWGLPASKRRAKDAGLLLAYEKTGYDATTPGRLPDLLDDWSVRRLKEAGADCIKILLYYTPFDPKHINDHKHAWVERIGDECRANDIPFFLEFVGYEEGADEKGLEFAKKKPEIVTGSMAEFTKDRYGVDVMKVEVPINMKFVEGAKAFGGQKAYTKQEAMDHFRRSADVATQAVHLPVGRRQQRRVHRVARARRRSRDAVLGCAVRTRDVEGRDLGLRQAGRPTRSASGSRTRASRTSSNVNARLKAAHPWFEFYGAKSADELAYNPTTPNSLLQLPSFSTRRWELGSWKLTGSTLRVGSATPPRSPSRDRCRRSTAHAPVVTPISAVPVSETWQLARPARVADRRWRSTGWSSRMRSLGRAGQLQIVGAGRAERAAGGIADLLGDVPLEVRAGAGRRDEAGRGPVADERSAAAGRRCRRVVALVADARERRDGDVRRDDDLCRVSS